MYHYFYEWLMDASKLQYQYVHNTGTGGTVQIQAVPGMVSYGTRSSKKDTVASTARHVSLFL